MFDFNLMSMGIDSISFSGTSRGMTPEQEKSFCNLMFTAPATVSFIHGDCEGSDHKAHCIVRQIKRLHPHIITYRPKDLSKCAFCDADEINKTNREYLKRNDLIVNRGQILIVTPKGYKELLRSGTWATVRYAHKVNKTVLVIDPSGEVKQYPC